MSNVHRFPPRSKPRTVREQIVASLCEPYPTADIIGLTPSDLADMAETIDCVGVFDSDADPRCRGSGDRHEPVDETARRWVEGGPAATFLSPKEHETDG